MGAVIVGVPTLTHRVLSAIDVQGAMRGAMTIIAVVVGLLLLVSAKHAGILPDGLLVKAEAREATERQPGLGASLPGLTFEAARWRAFLDSDSRPCVVDLKSQSLVARL